MYQGTAKDNKPRRAYIMKKVQFSTPYEEQVEVTVNGYKYGFLSFEEDQNAWVLFPVSIDDDGVLWPVSIDDGVSYSDDLAETEETITDEIQSCSED